MAIWEHLVALLSLPTLLTNNRPHTTYRTVLTNVIYSRSWTDKLYKDKKTNWSESYQWYTSLHTTLLKADWIGNDYSNHTVICKNSGLIILLHSATSSASSWSRTSWAWAWAWRAATVPWSSAPPSPHSSPEFWPASYGRHLPKQHHVCWIPCWRQYWQRRSLSNGSIGPGYVMLRSIPTATVFYPSAFDTVNHTALLRSIHESTMDANTVRWLCT